MNTKGLIRPSCSITVFSVVATRTFLSMAGQDFVSWFHAEYTKPAPYYFFLQEYDGKNGQTRRAFQFLSELRMPARSCSARLGYAHNMP